MAAKLNILLRERQLLSGSDANLQVHQIKPGHKFSDGMFDLQAGIHFQEIEIAVCVGEEFDGAGVAVAGGFGRLDRRLTHAAAHFRTDRGRRRFFEHLLMTALDGAFALSQINAVAVLVGKNLDFDVAGIGDGLLEINLVVAKGALGFAACGFETRCQFARPAPDACLCRRLRLRLST